MLQSLLKYRNLDSTADINSRFSKLFKKGFFDGGDVVPVSLQLKVQIQPFKAMSYDGMVVFDTSSTQLSVVAGQLNYVVLKAIYQFNDNPILAWEVLNSVSYLGHPNFDNLILRCIIDVPSLSTEVSTSMVSLVQSDTIDKLGRLPIRGWLSSVSLLPTKDNHVGDAYLVTDGTGDLPNIYVYNGVTFANVTTASFVSNTLTLHRQNLFSNEIHLTDDQAAALIGTSGTPALSNPFVTNEDPRLPSMDEKEALGGIANSTLDSQVILPSTSNRYITQSKLFAVGSEKIYLAGTGGVISIDAATDGPIWVGTGPDDTSAFQYFNLFNIDPNIDQEYINTNGKVPQITNIYIGSSLLTPSGSQTYPPLTSTPSGFIYSGTVHLVLDGSLFKVFNPIDINTLSDQITIPAHGLTANQRVRINTLGSYPSPLIQNTDYYVIVISPNIIQLSASSGPGAAVNLTTQGTGQFVLYDGLSVDSSFRLSYGRQFNLANMPPDALIRRKPSDAQKDAEFAVTTKNQEFAVTVIQDTFNLNPSIFDMYAGDDVVDINVFENGVKLLPNDSSFKPITIVSGVNDRIDFRDSTNTVYSIQLDPGSYLTVANLQSLASSITTKMDTISADTFVVTYNPTTFKFTFTNLTGNWQLLWNSGLYFKFNCAKELGFNKTDLTAATAYSSQNMIDRGYVGWYKVSATQFRLVRPAQPNGNITVEKIAAYNF